MDPAAAPFVAKKNVHMYLAPTNSGKTSCAIDVLAQAKTGAYAAPLRMLAVEAYTALCARLGPDSVGLITGEQRVNQTARIPESV